MAESLQQIAEQAVAIAMNAGATSADALTIDSTDMNAGIRHGAPETIERAESRGVGLRVFVGQSSATLSSSDLSKQALQKLAETAVAIAKVAPADPHAGLAPQELLAKKVPAVDSADPYEPSMETLQQLARDCEAAGRDVAGITNSEGADAGYSRQRIALVTSHGFAQGYESTQHAISCSLIAGEGEAMERDYDYVTTTYHTDLPAAARIGEEAARRTLVRMNPRKIASQSAPVFFDPRCAKQLLGAFAGAISGNAIARGTSFLKSELHEPVFSDAITIIDDPLLPRGLGSHPFDADGIAARKTAFVERGVLQHWLLDCRSARQLGMTTTGHAVRGLSSPTHPSATNMYIAAGQTSRDDLLKSVKNGLLVTETIGHGTNLITGDYSVGATGFWVENGEIQFPVSEVTIAGNLRDMFAQLVAADDLVFRHAFNTPTLMVPTMTIAGN